MELAKKGNKYIDQQAPWQLLKTDVPRMHTVLFVLIELLRYILTYLHHPSPRADGAVRVSAIVLEPLMPASSSKMLDLMGAPNGHLRSFSSIPLTGDIFRKDDSNMIPAGISLGGKPFPIFPKIEAGQSQQGTNPLPTEATNLPEEDFSLKYAADLNDLNRLAEKIIQVGDSIREMKKAKKSSEVDATTGKAQLKMKVNELIFLKDRYVICDCHFLKGNSFHSKVQAFK